MCFPVNICEISNNIFFNRIPPMAVFVVVISEQKIVEKNLLHTKNVSTCFQLLECFS